MALRPQRSVGPANAFVDTSGWLAFFSARDNHHAEADALFRLAVERRVRLITTSLVIAELHRLLLHRAGIRPAAVALELIDASANVSIRHADRGLHEAARGWLTRLSDQVITYTDACSFATMQDARCTTALSFDQDFVIAGFTLWRI